MTAAFFARAFFRAALFLAFARLGCAIFGFADDVAVVCGATPSGPFALAAGVTFVVVHLLFVAVAPILALASGLVAACLRRGN